MEVASVLAMRASFHLAVVLITTGVIAAACGDTTSSSLPPGDSGVATDASVPSNEAGAKDGAVVGNDASSALDSALPPESQCNTSEDCAWGEINHEILTAKDCVCLLGCPYLPLSKTTVDRRAAQYKALCTPNQDGNGNPCPVDDCAGPPAIACNNHVCGAPIVDAGHD
jgi:hypothetical protein